VPKGVQPVLVVVGLVAGVVLGIRAGLRGMRFYEQPVAAFFGPVASGVVALGSLGMALGLELGLVEVKVPWKRLLASVRAWPVGGGLRTLCSRLLHRCAVAVEAGKGEQDGRAFSNPASMLPSDVLSTAIRSGYAYGWRRQDVLGAIRAAPSAGLAILGGEVRFAVPGGACELYWMGWEIADRRANESWASYSARSAKEAADELRQLMSKDLVQEGVSHFDVLRKAHSQGICLEDHLLFVVDFAAQEAE
jgi:hypothetical protein